jgi:hypothetical protein
MSVHAPLRERAVLRVAGERGPIERTTAGTSRNRGRALLLLTGTLILTLAIFGPLLWPGVTILLDSPSSMMGPVPRLPSPGLGGTPGLMNTAPLDGLWLGLYRALPFGWTRLLPLLILPGLAVLGFRRLIGREPAPVLAAAVFYVVNPFTYDRMLAGQTGLLLGYALLPLFASLLASMLRGARSSTPPLAGLMLTILIATSIHYVFIGGLLLCSFAGVAAARRAWRALGRFAIAAATAVGSSLYWLIPAVGHWSQASRLTASNMQAFATAPDAHLGLAPNVLGLYGFWREGWPLAKDDLRAWPLFLSAILVVVAIGAASVWRRRRIGPVATAFACAALIGSVLALGATGPTGAGFRWLFVHVPPFRVMREPQKFLALLALGYAACFGLGVRSLRRAVVSRRWRGVILAVIVAIPCVYSFRTFWGFNGYVRPSTLPASWTAAAADVGEGPGSVLVLPWTQYVPFAWTQHRQVANPMASLFHRDTVVSGDPGLDGVPSRSAGVRETRIDVLLARASRVDDFGRLAAPLGIRFVALNKVDDWRTYAWLRHQRDLRLVHEWPDLALFESTVSTVRAWPRPSIPGIGVLGGVVSMVVSLIAVGLARRRTRNHGRSEVRQTRSPSTISSVAERPARAATAADT